MVAEQNISAGRTFAAMILKLNEFILRDAANWLAEQDEALAHVLQHAGYPPLWARNPSFATLTHIILEQQVSLASANAAFNKLNELLNHDLTPENFLSVSDENLKQIGFSKQKISYVRNLATAIEKQGLQLDQLEAASDESVKSTLMQLKGVGHWTADIYLSECLLRPDILPKGDIAMLEAIKVLKALPQRPDHAAFVALTEHWRPWRSVGTRMLWHYYLCKRKKNDS